MLKQLSLLALGALASCATSHPSVPTPDELGNRLRVRIAGRDVLSITSADYFLYAVVRGPDGERRGVNVLAPESASSEGLSLGLGMDIRRTFGLPDIEIAETLITEQNLSEDILLPDGYTLCFEPGTFYAYRIIDHGKTMAADLDPEVRLGSIRADGRHYFEVEPSDGPVIKRAATPPGWPPELAK